MPNPDYNALQPKFGEYRRLAGSAGVAADQGDEGLYKDARFQQFLSTGQGPAQKALQQAAPTASAASAAPKQAAAAAPPSEPTSSTQTSSSIAAPTAAPISFAASFSPAAAPTPVASEPISGLSSALAGLMATPQSVASATGEELAQFQPGQPGVLRQNLGQRNYPQQSASLASLRRVY